MKKITGYLFLGALAMCLCVFNLSIQSNQVVAKGASIQPLNIKAVQASAGELWCDATTTSVCTIERPEGTGYGTGVGRGSN